MSRRPRAWGSAIFPAAPAAVADAVGPLSALLLCATLISSCGGGDPATGQAADAGRVPIAGPPFPPLTLRELGGTVTELARYRGQPVIVSFWATWCAPCLREMPSLVSLQNRFADRGLRVLAVSIDEDSGAVQAYVAETELPFEIFWDPAKEAYRACGVSVTPTAFILDREGRVVERIEGEMDWTDPALITTLEHVLGSV